MRVNLVEGVKIEVVFRLAVWKKDAKLISNTIMITELSILTGKSLIF
jgi:hypothetical protein